MIQLSGFNGTMGARPPGTCTCYENAILSFVKIIGTDGGVLHSSLRYTTCRRGYVYLVLETVEKLLFA